MEYTKNCDYSTIVCDNGHTYCWMVTNKELNERYSHLLPKNRLEALKEELITQAKEHQLIIKN